MRPRYETEEDRSAEREIIDCFARWRGAEAKKLPDDYRYAAIDCGIFKGGKMVAVAEVKDRRGWKREYGDVMLSVYKARELFGYAAMGLPAFFVVRLCGAIYYVRIGSPVGAYKITWAGRSDRADKYDKEPCIHIPFDKFRAVPE